jgi:hypothetical protein
MSLRNFRRTAALLALGLLQGCSGARQNVSAPAAPKGQVSSIAADEANRDNRFELASAEGRGEPTGKNALPLDTGTPKETAHGGISLSAVPLDSRDPDVLTNMGIVALRKGDLTRAEQLLRSALEIDPQHRSALLNLAQVYSKQGRTEEAAALFGARLSKDPAPDRPAGHSRATPIDPPRAGDESYPPEQLTTDTKTLTVPETPASPITGDVAMIYSVPAPPIGDIGPDDPEAPATPHLAVDHANVDRALPLTPTQRAPLPAPSASEASWLPVPPVVQRADVPHEPFSPSAPLPGHVAKPEGPATAPPVVTVAPPVEEQDREPVPSRKPVARLLPPSLSSVAPAPLVLVRPESPAPPIKQAQNLEPVSVDISHTVPKPAPQPVAAAPASPPINVVITDVKAQ